MVKNSIKPTYDLKDVKQAIMDGRVLLRGRPKNLATLKNMGLTIKDAKEELLRLRPSHFHDISPLPNKCWADIYKKTISGTKIYIKFIIDEKNDLVIISFHKDEKRLAL